MRKTMLSTALLLAAVSANTYAQEAKAGDFNVGITAGGGAAFEWVNRLSLDEQHPIANIQLGVTFDYCFKDNKFIETGLLLERKGGKSKTEYEMAGVKNKVTTTQTPIYLELPVTFNYRINAGKIGIIPQIGAYAALGLVGTYLYDYHQTGNDGSSDKIIGGQHDADPNSDISQNAPMFGGTEGRNRFDGGVRVGVGFAFSPKVKLSLGYDMGLFNTLYSRRGKAVCCRNQAAFGTITYYFK